MSTDTQTPQTSINANVSETVNKAQAKENTSKSKVNNDFTPNFNVRNARVTDVNFIKSLAINGKSVGEALSQVVELAQAAPQLKDNEEIITITDDLLKFADATDIDVNFTISRLISELELLKNENARLRLDAQGKELKNGEVIITFTDKTAESIRKVRPFIARSGYIVYEKNNNTDFLNKLVNHAVNKVLRIDFDNVVNPL